MSKINMTENAGSGFSMVENAVERLTFKGLGKTTIFGKNAAGDILWTEEHEGPNAVTDAGALYLFQQLFGSTANYAKPATNNWYMGLIRGNAAADATTPTGVGAGSNGSAPTASSTLTTIATDEGAIGGNYARIVISQWQTTAPGISGRQAASGNITWTAGAGGWTNPVTHMFLCTAASSTTGTMFNYYTLQSTRWPKATGDSVTVSWTGSL